jgi:hypothetical protein
MRAHHHHPRTAGRSRHFPPSAAHRGNTALIAGFAAVDEVESVVLAATSEDELRAGHEEDRFGFARQVGRQGRGGRLGVVGHRMTAWAL